MDGGEEDEDEDEEEDEGEEGAEEEVVVPVPAVTAAAELVAVERGRIGVEGGSVIECIYMQKGHQIGFFICVSQK